MNYQTFEENNKEVLAVVLSKILNQDLSHASRPELVSLMVENNLIDQVIQTIKSPFIA